MQMINQYVFGLIVTTVAITSLVLASVINTKVVDTSDCAIFPQAYFLNSSSPIPYDIIYNAISNATERLTIAITSISKRDQERILEPLKHAKIAKDKIKIIMPFDYTFNQSLSELGISYYHKMESIQTKKAFHLIVADDNGYFAPFIEDQATYSQLVALEKCKVGADDIQAFIDYFVAVELENIPKIVPLTMQAKTSAIFPVEKDGAKFYTFYNHDDILMPYRITTNDVLNSTFANEPKELLIFTESNPTLTSFSGYESAQFSLYLYLKALLLRKRTNIKFLSMKKVTPNVWRESLMFFDNIDIRLYDRAYKGLNFIIADDWTFVFSHNIQSYDINEKISLHYATNDKETKRRALEIFNEVWNVSTEDF